MYKILCSGMGAYGESSGIFEYIRETVNILCVHHRVDLLLLEKDVALFKNSTPNLRIVPVPDRYGARWLNWFWHLLLPFNRDMSGYDFVFLPAGNRRLLWNCPRPTVVTFHDLAGFHIPGEYSWLKKFFLRLFVPRLLKKAAIIMSISESTRQDMIRYYGIPGERVMVNYNGFNSAHYYPDPDHNEPDILAKLRITPGYILYIARIEHPEKNHITLLKAYEQLPEWLKKNHPLVCAGNLWHNWEKVLNYAENSLDRERLLFPGFVPDDWLPCLYRNAALYVFPSLYEGFGFPLLEAMSCGIPVACSNRSSLPEIGGTAVITFDPEAPESIRNAMQSVLTDPVLRNDLISKGYTRKEEFTWQKHVDNLIAAYEKYSGKKND